LWVHAVNRLQRDPRAVSASITGMKRWAWGLRTMFTAYRTQRTSPSGLTMSVDGREPDVIAKPQQGNPADTERTWIAGFHLIATSPQTTVTSNQTNAIPTSFALNWRFIRQAREFGQVA
jgi:hypothetical protein